MATRALDIVTIIHALKNLEKELEIKRWDSFSPQQFRAFAFLKKYGSEVEKISGLKAKASQDYQVLNKFLAENKFTPVFEPFSPIDGFGVVSIIDKLVKWLSGQAKEVTIVANNHSQLPGFHLPATDVNVYLVDGYGGSYLLELKTQSDDTLWLFVHDDQKIARLDLVELSFDVMAKNRGIAKIKMLGERYSQNAFAGAQIPMVDFDIMPDLGWLLGAVGVGEKDDWTVTQAHQQFKMRMDSHGARVKVATSLGMMRCCTKILRETEPFVVRQPFYGWFTQKGVNLPLAAFFVDYESMKRPAGSLEDL